MERIQKAAAIAHGSKHAKMNTSEISHHTSFWNAIAMPPFKYLQRNVFIAESQFLIIVPFVKLHLQKKVTYNSKLITEMQLQL